MNYPAADGVEITFVPSGISGLVAVGTYVEEAARRLGVKLRGKCFARKGVHFCQFSVLDDSVLSPPTSEERKFFVDKMQDSTGARRLGCQARFDRPCTVEVVMPAGDEKNESENEHRSDSAAKQNQEYIKFFSALPLEQKIAELVKLEAITFADTMDYVLNAPFNVGDKILTALANFGLDIERKESDAARPREHTEKPAASDEKE